MGNLLNNLSWLDYFGLFVFAIFIYSNIIGLIRYRLTVFNLSKGNVLDCLEKFPVHMTSADAYLTSKNKVDHFMNLLLTEQQAELFLSQEDINNLYIKGIILNKYRPGKYLYYQIDNNVILENLIAGPLFSSIKVYRTRIKELSFSNQKPEAYSRILEEYGRKMNENKKDFPLHLSTLILFLLGGLRSPDGRFYGYQETVEYQKASILIKKIKNVEISNGYLIMRSQ